MGGACEKCHLASGRGGIFDDPRLAGSAVVQADDSASLINTILYGLDPLPSLGECGRWESMKPYEDMLTDNEIAPDSNYVRQSWSNKGDAVTAHEVAQQY